jgi:hypothetical protein
MRLAAARTVGPTESQEAGEDGRVCSQRVSVIAIADKVSFQFLSHHANENVDPEIKFSVSSRISVGAIWRFPVAAAGSWR